MARSKRQRASASGTQARDEAWQLTDRSWDGLPRCGLAWFRLAVHVRSERTGLCEVVCLFEGASLSPFALSNQQPMWYQTMEIDLRRFSYFVIQPTPLAVCG